MKRTLILLLLNGILVHPIFCQDMVQKIKDSYNLLDSINYSEEIIDLFGEQVSKEINEMEDLILEIRGKDYSNQDSFQKHQLIDSIMGKIEYSKALIDDRINWFAKNIRDQSADYVLNLNIEISSKNQVCLVPDTSSLPFNLLYFDKRSNVKFIVLVDNGQISHYDTNYSTFSKSIGKNYRKVFRKIRREDPKYLLYSYDLEQMNTMLYLLNDKIYVYRIAQMEKYELNEYIKKFAIGNNGNMMRPSNSGNE